MVKHSVSSIFPSIFGGSEGHRGRQRPGAPGGALRAPHGAAAAAAGGGGGAPGDGEDAAGGGDGVKPSGKWWFNGDLMVI